MSRPPTPPGRSLDTRIRQLSGEPQTGKSVAVLSAVMDADRAGIKAAKRRGA